MALPLLRHAPGRRAPGELHLKYETAQYVVTGPVTAICRRCSEVNEITCAPANAASGRAA